MRDFVENLVGNNNIPSFGAPGRSTGVIPDLLLLLLQACSVPPLPFVTG
jgi:hypothetical protein